MFPIAQNCPSRRLDSPVVPAIALHVGPDLGPPPVTVPLGHRPVFGARMPEASVKEHRDTGSGELEIRPCSPGTGNRAVHPEPQALGMNLTPDRHLKGGVSAACVAHPPSRSGIGPRLFGSEISVFHRPENSDASIYLSYRSRKRRSPRVPSIRLPDPSRV